MPKPIVAEWRCTVCGYVHRGPAPPDTCPVCGVSKESFEPNVVPAGASEIAPAAEWRCLNCSHVHSGPEPPPTCPVCGARADRFVPHAGDAASASPREGAASVVVVGGGVAGVSAASAAREANARVTLVAKEGPPVYRLNLTRYLAGEIEAEQLRLHPQAWYDDKGIRVLFAEATALDLVSRRVRTRAGEALEFDKLVITAGSHPFVPPFAGTNREGVMAFRTVADAERILEAVTSGARSAVIGGGILGLETAGAMARRGGKVTVIEGFGWLLPRQLNERAARILESHVRRQGIEIRTLAKTKELAGDERVREVVLEDGTVPAELVVVSTGIRPNSYLARLAGIEVSRGVVVDDHLRTSHPDVLAAGDVAEHRGVVHGLWMPSMAQGRVAGLGAAGTDAEMGELPRANTLKVLDFEMFSVGVFEPPDASFVVLEEEGDAAYARFLFRDTHMVGAVLLGDTSLAGRAKMAIEEESDFSRILGASASVASVAEFLSRGAG
jgi:nitrite reductase (NADH) large subunit